MATWTKPNICTFQRLWRERGSSYKMWIREFSLLWHANDRSQCLYGDVGQLKPANGCSYEMSPFTKLNGVQQLWWRDRIWHLCKDGVLWWQQAFAMRQGAPIKWHLELLAKIKKSFKSANDHETKIRGVCYIMDEEGCARACTIKIIILFKHLTAHDNLTNTQHRCIKTALNYKTRL
jgi:hypothetical protein